MDFKEFTIDYISKLYKTLQKLDLIQLEEFKNHLLTNEGRIYIIGNGGSSSTASHMANDLSIGLKRREKQSFDVVSLSDNSAISYAIANDIGFENVFYMQLKDILKPKDTVIAISCSGNSPNIIKAITYAKEVGSTIVGLSGFDGGKLYELADIKIHIPSEKNEYGLVEDIHQIIDHILFTYFIKDTSEK